MSRWGPYVPVAARRAQAEREIKRLRKGGQITSPVAIEGSHIAKTFWGKAWCDNLEHYRDYENRLPRGRSYVRNGSVVDLQIAPSLVTAMVMGSSMYRVSVKITPLPKARWTALCQDCAGSIDSVVELLQGRLSKGVMERLCRQDEGLFPKPSDIKLSCSCPDYSDMCKHVAAALYGVGARLDERPDLLFRLRSVDEKEIVGHLDKGFALSKPGAVTGAVLDVEDLSALFGLDMAEASSLRPPEPSRAPDAPVSRASTAAAVTPGGTKQSAMVAKAKKPPGPRLAALLAETDPAKSRRTVAEAKQPVRYLTVEEALIRSGKTPANRTPAKSKAGISKPLQQEAVPRRATPVTPKAQCKTR